MRDYTALRQRMIKEQIRGRGLKDPAVMRALEKVERHLFVLPKDEHLAYGDHPLDIGWGQTISQPYIVALMTVLCSLTSKTRVLEVGTGCGYQSAILAELSHKVYSMEIVSPLAQNAKSRLKKLGYHNIYFREGDGSQGWPEKGPFDVVLAAAASQELPPKLIEQLKVGGRMLIPLISRGQTEQELLLITKKAKGIDKSSIAPVRFVLMRRKK